MLVFVSMFRSGGQGRGALQEPTTSVPFKLMTSRILAVSVSVLLRVMGCLVDCRSGGMLVCVMVLQQARAGYILLVGLLLFCCGGHPKPNRILRNRPWRR